MKYRWFLMLAISVSQVASATLESQAVLSHDKTHIQTARYSYEKLAVNDDQQDLLSVVVQLQFPQEIIDVGGALDYLLIPSGFKLENPELSDQSQYFLYGLNLPEVHRELGPIRLEDALELLGNRGFKMIVNPVKRTVGYRLMPAYRQYLDDQSIEKAKTRWQAKLDAMETAGYGPVKKNETLSAIVYSLKPRSKQSKPYFEQCLLAFYQKTPSAFLQGNMNLLQEGSVLSIPTEAAIRLIPLAQAGHIVNAHVKAWQALLNGAQ